MRIIIQTIDTAFRFLLMLLLISGMWFASLITYFFPIKNDDNENGILKVQILICICSALNVFVIFPAIVFAIIYIASHLTWIG